MTDTSPRHNPDYLAKDFNSFRALLLDHLAALAPESAPFEVASVESTLAEILAYAGDYLSYYQDAVATEAYLATARQRISLRRHARLVDYAPNEGCSARVWAHFEVSAEQLTLPRGTPLLTRIADLGAARLPAGFDSGGQEMFETMHDATLARAHNRMALAGFGAPAPGATSASLAGSFPALEPGEVLVLRNSSRAWAQAVRLTSATAAAETGIAWHIEDALPAALPQGGAWEVLGNIVLADHGRSDSLKLPKVGREGVREMAIACPHLVFATPYRHEKATALPAAEAMRQDPRAAEPSITLREVASFLDGAALARRPRWTGTRDLVHASQFDRVFAAEPAGEGTVNLRFGDGDHGRRLQPDWDHVVHYRTGNGARGNIGPNTLAHVVSDDERILAVSNPIAGSGGSDPETLDEIRALAPLAADVQRRCVSERDYVAMTRQFPGVRAAVAKRAWTRRGSRVTLHVCRDRDYPWDRAFHDRLRAALASFQLIGDDLSIHGAHYVEPEVVMALEVERPEAWDEIAALVRARMAAMTFAFGEPPEPARLAACASAVPGVVGARVAGVWREGEAAIPPGPFELGPTEVIRLDPARIGLDPAPGQ